MLACPRVLAERQSRHFRSMTAGTRRDSFLSTLERKFGRVRKLDINKGRHGLVEHAGACDGRTPRSSAPESEARDSEIVVEPEHILATCRVHDREAHRVGIADGMIREAVEPFPSRSVVLGVGEVDGEPLTRDEMIQRVQRRPGSGLEQQEPVDFCDDQVTRVESNASFGRLPEQRLGFGVMLIARADQRDPSATIDERAFGTACAHARPPVGRDTARPAPRRRSGSDIGRSARSRLAEGRRSSR